MSRRRIGNRSGGPLVREPDMSFGWVDADQIDRGSDLGSFLEVAGNAYRRRRAPGALKVRQLEPIGLLASTRYRDSHVLGIDPRAIADGEVEIEKHTGLLGGWRPGEL